VAGLIAFQDTREAGLLREISPEGQGQPPNPKTAIIIRRDVEELLTKMAGTERWLEPAGEPQRVLPVVVATRNGFKFGFFPLGTADADDAGSHSQ